MKKTCLAVILLAGCFFKAQSQNNAFEKNIFPQSPTASELGKYGAYPVDLSTGVPQIDIPLYVVKSGDLEVPIKLSYHASGIRVNEESGWVGQNWSLSTGGLINLEVRDTPDELEPKINDLPNTNDISNYLNSHPHEYNTAFLKDFRTYSRVKDAYHISLPTVSGTFFLNDFNADGSIASKFPVDEYKIFRNTAINVNNDYLYKIIDKEGNTYKFSDYEKSQTLKTQNSPDYPTPHVHAPYKSAWLLTEMASPKGDKITFTYGNRYDNWSDAESHLIQVDNTAYSYTHVSCQGDQVNKPYYAFEIKPLQKNGTNTYNEANKVKEIHFDGGRLRFVMGTGVIGYVGQYLQSIVVEREAQVPGTYEPVKEFKLGYELYNTASSTGGGTTQKEKLKLVNVEELTFGNVPISEKVIQFVYDNTPVPKANSYSQDLFGYYNGKPNLSLIQKRYVPFERQIQPGQIVRTIYQVGDSDRSVSSQFLQAGILKEIIHPTKGKTSFEYEPNTYRGTETLVLGEEKRFLHLSNIGRGSVAPGNGQINFNMSPPFSDCISTCAPNMNYCCPGFESTSYNTADLQDQYLLLSYKVTCSGPCDDQAAKHSKAIIKVHDGSGEIYSVALKSGSQQLQQIPLNHPGGVTVGLQVWGDNIDGYVEVVTNRKDQTQENNVYSGGLRVKSITQKDSDDTFVSAKRYRYNQPGDPSKTSGVLVNQYRENKYVTEDVNKLYTNSKYFECTGPIGGVMGYIMREDFISQHNFLSNGKTNMDKASTRYEYVTEEDVDAGNIAKGKTEYRFTNESDLVVTPDLYLSRPTLNGLPKSTSVYNDANVMLEREVTEYVHKPEKTSFKEDFKLYKLYDVLPGTQFPQHARESFLCFEPVNSKFTDDWNVLKSKEETEYYPQNGSIVNKEEYFYDNPLHQNITKQKATSPDGTVSETAYRYAHEKGNQLMTGKNVVGIPLETIVTQTTGGTTKTLSKTETVYPSAIPSPQTSDKILPLSVREYDVLNATNLYTEVTYDKYDANGNLLQYTTKDGTPVSVVWGYKNTLPVAKIEGIAYNELSANASPSGIIAASDEDALDPSKEGQLIDALNNFGKLPALADKQVTTYTYDPLIGVTNVISSSGVRSRYLYDAAGRLMEITAREKDASGNYVERRVTQFKYNYKQ